VVEKFTTPENLTLLNRLPRTPWPYPTATWDIIRGGRYVAQPNVPNSEAHVVAPLGRAQQSSSFIYLREKKVFSPTTLHWVRQPGDIQPGDIAKANAEAAVLREVNDLNVRFDNFAEYVAWQALKGTLTLDYPDVQASIDYGIANSHKPSAGTSWASATVAQIMDDIRAWKRLIARDGRVPATEAWATEKTIARIMNAFATIGTSAHGPDFLSDRMKEEFYRSGVLPGFMGLDWHTVEAVYDTDGDVQTLFVADDSVFVTNLSSGRPMEVLEGPTADDEAPVGHTGKFSKTWKEKDPSARQFLLEWNIIPVITRVEQFVYVADVAP
jgi:hypothetical protein